MGAVKITFWVLIYCSIVNLYSIYKVINSPEELREFERQQSKKILDIRPTDEPPTMFYLVKGAWLLGCALGASYLYFAYDLIF